MLELPLLPIKNTVLFPHLMMPLAIGRARSIAAATAATATEEKLLVVVAQRDADIEQPGPEHLYTVGTIAVVRKMVKGEQGLELLVSGTERVSVLRVEDAASASAPAGRDAGATYLRARVRVMPLPEDAGTEVEALQRAVVELAQKAMELAQPHSQTNIEQILTQNRDPIWLAHMIASMLGLDVSQQQALLESKSRVGALRLVHGYLSHEIQVLEVRSKIAQQAEGEMTKQQRDYVLRQQLRAIQDELGEKNPEKAEVEDLRKRLEEAKLPPDALKEAERQLGILERMPPAAPDYQMTRAHVELIIELPWSKSTTDSIDILEAQQVLDEDHYDLADVKERILEHLAVMKLNPTGHAPILCFVGPPGVGKTSLGQSIARAMGRKFERMSLGGLHDEAELRGHRRTYIGAMPGRIIQAIRRAEVNNPLLMLDEVDKLGRDFRGDPAAALMEILDPAQNTNFHDNYLDLPFDLSRVLFIGTANTLDTIPRPLLDRMEILRLSGYAQEEKLVIARRYLVPRQVQAAGLSEEKLEIPDETLSLVIARYTREAGVRELERSLGRIGRKVARRVAEGHTEKVVVRPDDLPNLLGAERFFPERARKQLPAGVATGLAWTETGGEVLYIEGALLPDSKGHLRLTGQLGEVMRESAKAAQSYIWAHAEMLGIDRNQFKDSGVHIHVPSGAVPKDGPSAGVALATALVSLYRNSPTASNVAMTGEITLTGLVLPVGGIKEKVLAARRSGIYKVVIPKDNAKDIVELPEQIRKEMTFVLTERIDEVLAAAIPEALHLAGV
ncbi:MAG TPA: endopeptidase La [Planctomycetota bacterium]